MSTSTKLQSAFQKVIDRAGTQVRINYYTKTTGSIYDDDVTLTVGSSVWTSGVIFPLNTYPSSTDAVLVQQGKLDSNDSKLFLSGGVGLTGEDGIVKIGVGGSPIPLNEFFVMPLGIHNHQVGVVNIYKKVWIRSLQNGSLIGE